METVAHERRTRLVLRHAQEDLGDALSNILYYSNFAYGMEYRVA